MTCGPTGEAMSVEMIDDDERLDELTTAVAHATYAAAEANVIRQRGVETFLIGAGVCLALIGGGFFIAAKGHVVEVPGNDGAAGVATSARAELSVQAPPPVTEREFMSRPEFKTAEYQGRLIADPGGLIRFDTGTSAFALAKYDPASGHMVPDREATLNAARFVGDLAECHSIPSSELLKCFALDRGIVVDLEAPEK